MVGNITSLTGKGLRDWLIQRVTAVLIGLYAVFIFAYLFTHPGLTYVAWQDLFDNTCMRVASVLVLFAFVLHAWIGLWTVTTDYIKNSGLRLLVQVLIIVSLLAMLLWGIEIFWGV